MTSIHEIKNSNGPNLLNFLEGKRAFAYTEPEEKGFHTTGNIGALLNSNPSKLLSIKDGILFNPTNLTNSNNTLIGRVHPMKNDWRILTATEPNTETFYCNPQPLSELLPNYPNGVPNTILNPTCNMTIEGKASPTLAGISLMGINDPDVLNNATNDIGHELNAYGHANRYGTRALGEGKNSCQKLTPGLNVPPLKVQENRNDSYIAKPSPSLPHQTYNNLYQVGNWTYEKQFPNNFINEFNNYVGEGCNGPPGPPRPPRPPHPSGPGGRRPYQREQM